MKAGGVTHPMERQLWHRLVRNVCPGNDNHEAFSEKEDNSLLTLKCIQVQKTVTAETPCRAVLKGNEMLLDNVCEDKRRNPGFKVDL